MQSISEVEKRSAGDGTTISRVCLCLLAFGCLFGSGCRTEVPPQAVILISIDTLRPDHLGCYGYGRETSPFLDQLARDDFVLFEQAYANAPYTLPTHMTMMTGLYPEAHGMLRPFIKGHPEKMVRLSPLVPTLAEILKKAGFETAAFTDGGFVGARYGFDRGFDSYDDNSSEKVGAGFVRFQDNALEFIRSQKDSDFFLFLHTFDTHAPYEPPAEFVNRFQGVAPGRELRSSSLLAPSYLAINDGFGVADAEGVQEIVDAYDACIRFVDGQIKAIVATLKEVDRWENAIIVLTSDHGEGFLENGITVGHGLFLTHDQLRIPLLVKLPDGEFSGTRVSHVVEHTDILPTVLSGLKLATPKHVDGQDMLAGLRNDEWSKDHAFAISPNSNDIHSLLRGNLKFIEGVKDPRNIGLRCHLLPTNPQEVPRGLDYKVKERSFCYHFGRDPLGVVEEWKLKDRVYDLSSHAEEWKSRLIPSPDILQAEKKAALDLASAAQEKVRQWMPEVVEQEISSSEISRLESLGYAGVIAAAQPEETPGADETELPLKPWPDRTVIDRDLLHEVDRIIWDLSRIWRASKEVSSTQLNEQVDRAKTNLGTFLQKNPELGNWTEWRVLRLNNLSTALGKEKPGN